MFLDVDGFRNYFVFEKTSNLCLDVLEFYFLMLLVYESESFSTEISISPFIIGFIVVK